MKQEKRDKIIDIAVFVFLLVAVLSYLMGLSAGAETMKMIFAGFVVFMIPVVGEAVVTAVAALNAGMRNFIRS